MGAPIVLSPQVISSGIGALGSIGSSFLNGILNYNSMSKQVEYAKDLMQYQWENFTSPSAQVKSLAAAGINPAVALGDSTGFTASPSVNMPSSHPPQVAGIQDIGNFVKAMADAKNAGFDSVAKELQNEITRQTLDQQILSASLSNKFTQEQTNKIIAEWNKIIGETNILHREAQIKEIDLQKHEKLVDSLIDTQVARANLDEQSAKQIREQLPIILDKLKAEERVLSVDADISESYKSTMAATGVVGSAVKIIAMLAKILK